MSPAEIPRSESTRTKVRKSATVELKLALRNELKTITSATSSHSSAGGIPNQVLIGLIDFVVFPLIVTISTITTSARPQLDNSYHLKWAAWTPQLYFADLHRYCSCWSLPMLFCLQVKSVGSRRSPEFKDQRSGLSRFPLASCVTLGWPLVFLMLHLNICKMKLIIIKPAFERCGKTKRSQCIWKVSSNIRSEQNQSKGECSPDKMAVPILKRITPEVYWAVQMLVVIVAVGIKMSVPNFWLCPHSFPNPRGGLRHSGEHERLEAKVLWITLIYWAQHHWGVNTHKNPKVFLKHPPQHTELYTNLNLA